MNRDDLFADWKRRAAERDILQEAIERGAKLKRAGREWIGPCPACGGSDRFGINPQKSVFNCRGAEGGNVISMVMHVDGVSFLQACEALTGEPSPKGHSAPLSASDVAARDRRRQENEARQRALKEQQDAYQEDTLEAASRIWGASTPITGTIAAAYLTSRHLPTPDADVIRFHPGLPYPGKSARYPALVCRVDDLSGDLTAVWRVFLRSDGRKLDVENPKLGLGPAGGGAVRIGGAGKIIGVAEGAETALACHEMIAHRHPVWAALSTSGMIGLEIPLGVEKVFIFPDGDSSLRKRGEEYEAAIPAGRKAAQALKERLKTEGIACVIAPEPAPGLDYLDVWQSMAREVA